MKKALLICITAMLATSCTGVFAAGNKHAKATDRITKQAWGYFNTGKYAKARKLVDRYYAKDNVSLSLLSGVLYARQGKCRKALAATQYVAAYIDARGIGSVSRSQAIKEPYLGMKLLGVKCHMQLEQWYDAAHDAKIYLKFDPDNQAVLLALADSSTELARKSKDTAIATFERAWKIYHPGASDSAKKGPANGGMTAAISNDDDVFWLRLVELYEWDGRHEKAVDFTVKLLSESRHASKIVEAMKKQPNFARVLDSSAVKEKIREAGLK